MAWLGAEPGRQRAISTRLPGRARTSPWDLTSFAAFIAEIPGNKMVFVGIKDETEIANLWAYLSHFNADGSSK
jgi:cytochrome c2